MHVWIARLTRSYSRFQMSAAVFDINLTALKTVSGCQVPALSYSLPKVGESIQSSPLSLLEYLFQSSGILIKINYMLSYSF